MKSLPYITFFKKVLPVVLIILFLILPAVPIFSQNHTKNGIRTIVIDPGHGGKDPGSIGKIVSEKEVVLKISLKVGNYIKKYLPEVKVIYTRSTDVFIPLVDRADIANKNQADLFISIHANSNTKTTPHGTETYALGYSKAQSNLDVAIKENSVIKMEDDHANKYGDFDPNSPESYIIFSLVQNTFLTQSLTFAGLIQEQFSQKAQRTDRGVKQAGFLVLWQTTMPSVLIEVGFVSNPEEEKFLRSEKGQDVIASAIFRAFRNYKNQIEGYSNYVNKITTNDSVFMDTTPAITHPADTSLPIASNDTVSEITEANPVSTIEYSIQVSTSQNKISLKSAFFKGFTDVEEIHTGNTYKYVIGTKKTYEEALEYSKIVKNYFPDAFIVALNKGKIIPLKEAFKGIKN